MKNITINMIRPNYFQVIADTERFGIQEILFEGINRAECLVFISANNGEYEDNSKELIFSILKEKGFNDKLYWGSFYNIIPELYMAMEKCYSNIQNAGMDTDYFSFKIEGNILKMEMGAYNRNQKINWDIVKNCKVDLRKKEYKQSKSFL